MESRRDGSPKHLVQMGAHQSSSLGRPLRRALHVPGLPFPVHHQIAHAPYLQERHFVTGAHMRGGGSFHGLQEGVPAPMQIVTVLSLSLIHISEPTRRTPISYAVFCL